MSGRLEEGEVTSGNNHGICERTKIFEFPGDSVIPAKGGKLPGIAHADCCLSRKTAIGQERTDTALKKLKLYVLLVISQLDDKPKQSTAGDYRHSDLKIEQLTTIVFTGRKALPNFL